MKYQKVFFFLFLAICILTTVRYNFVIRPQSETDAGYLSTKRQGIINTTGRPPPATLSTALFVKSHTVVKHIHQSWKTHTLPPRFDFWSKSWLKCFPTWKYTLWSDVDNLQFIEQNYSWMLEFYKSLPREIFRADAMRYLYMYHFGGIYVDLDAECLQPFEQLLLNYSIVLGAMQGQNGPPVQEGHVENSFMYSQPKHPFWRQVIEEMMRRNQGEPGERTGPYLLADCINKYRSTYEKEWRIYSPKYFNPFSFVEPSPIADCKILNKMTMTEVHKCRAYHTARGSYVLQYHTTTWRGGDILKRRRRRRRR